MMYSYKGEKGMRFNSAAAPATVFEDESLNIHSVYRGRKRRG